MDYTIFNPEQTAREGGESEQAHMERVLRDA